MDLATIETLFWIALGVLVYTWFGYPALLFVCERLMYTPVRREAITPSVSVLVVAHDEEDVLACKIENLLALDYPKGLLEIVIASDGSHDRTAEIARAYQNQGVELREFPVRRGKASVLNDIVPDLAGEIVVLADARQRLERDVLRKLVANFADPAVGGVSGELVLETPEAAGIALSMNAYWRYEKWIRAKESNIHSTVGGTGAIFALRKELYRPLPGETILDDVVLPFQIVKRGFRVIMERGARAWDVAYESWQREFARKARTLSGNFQMLFHFRRMGAGVLGPISFQYYSHKVLRLVGPFCLLALFLANWTLARAVAPGTGWQSFYAACMIGQLLFYAVAAAGFFFRGRLLKVPFVAVPNAFVLMQTAVVVGLLRYASGRDDALWERAHALDPVSLQRRLWRLVLDSFLFTAGFVLAYYLRYLGAPPQEALDSYMALFPYFDISVPGLDLLVDQSAPFVIRLAVPLVMLIPLGVFYFFRINETRTEEIDPEYFLTLIKGIFYATLILLLVIYVRRASVLQPMEAGGPARLISVPSSVLLIGFLLNCALLGGWRLAAIWFRRAAVDTPEEPPDLMLVSNAPLEPAWLDRAARAFDPPARFVPAHAAEEGDPRVTPAPEVRSALMRIRPDGLLVDTGSLSREGMLETIGLADERRLPVHLVPGELELLLAQTAPRLTSYIPILDPARPSSSEITRTVKRGIDIALGLSSIAGVPFLAGLMVASRLVSPPHQRVRVEGVCRVGRYGQGFVSPRLRFAHGWPSWWVGLARWSLLGAELLAGHRSLVGPPALLAGQFERLNPLARRFFTCRPGIVPVQGVFPAGAKRLDRRSARILYYVRHRSLSLDVQVLLARRQKTS